MRLSGASVSVPVVGRKKLLDKESTIKAITKIQVAFSTTSLLRLTPIIWFGAAKLEAIPPPLGF